MTLKYRRVSEILADPAAYALVLACVDRAVGAKIKIEKAKARISEIRRECAKLGLTPSEFNERLRALEECSVMPSLHTLQ